MAHRGALAVEPMMRRCSRSSTLITTPSTSKPNVWRASVKTWMRSHTSSIVSTEVDCTGTGSPQARAQSRYSV